MTKNILLATALLTTVVTAMPQSAYAVTAPSFPSCVNPQGQLKTYYPEGIHGIVGMNGTFTGSDKVYSIDGYNIVMQCFCPENGGGIQTNWWRVEDRSENEIKQLENEGWTLVGEGSAWGLSEGKYVAKNIEYSCKSTTTTTTTVTNNNTTNNNTTNNNTTNNNGVVESVKTVARLASTGNTAFLLFVAALGTVSLAFGALLKVFRK